MDKILGDKIKAIAKDMRKSDLLYQKLREDIDKLVEYVNQKESKEGLQ